MNEEDRRQLQEDPERYRKTLCSRHGGIQLGERLLQGGVK